MNDLPDPFEIDGYVLAIVLQKGDGHARNGSRLHVRESLFEDGQTVDADNCFDLASGDKRGHEGRPLGDQHGITEALFGLLLKVLDRAQAALLATRDRIRQMARGNALPHEGI